MENLPVPRIRIPRWEYARLYYRFATHGIAGDEGAPAGGHVTFSHADQDWDIGDNGQWDALKRLGDEGWELVTKTNYSPDSLFGGGGYEMYFKRQQLE